MKIFLLIFIFALSLKADSSYQSKCVKDFYLTSNGTSPTQGTHLINIYFSKTPNILYQYTYSTAIITELVNTKDLFEYDPIAQTCNLIKKNNTLGLTNEEYNFMMALTGLLSSILLVSIIFRKV